jgi:hypothetical protein
MRKRPKIRNSEVASEVAEEMIAGGRAAQILKL